MWELPTMASQAIGSQPRRQPTIGVKSAGLVLAALLGGWHLLWALLVASGVAQAVVDFVFWLHFIRPVYVIEAFDPLRAAGLVLFTGAIGYALGAAFAFLWNQIHRGPA
jgi:hypothetical protein